MIPPLKIKCKKQQYCADGSCRYLGKVKDREPCPCLKQNCIYYDGETNERDTVLDDLCNIDLTYYIWGEKQSDEVGLCRGRTCNYCGRYNVELLQQAGVQR